MYGLTKIEMGDIAGDGGMGATLADIGDPYEGTVEITHDDPTITEFKSETKDDAILTTEKGGKKTVKFSIVDMTPTNLAKFLGGTAGAISTTFNTLKLPDSLPVIEKSFKFTTKDGGYIQIPRLKIVAKVNMKFSSANMLMVDVVGTVLTPTKAGEGSMLIANPQ